MPHSTPSDNPKVGIIIPVFNNSNELAELLNQIYKIEYKHFDIITIDNGSTVPINDLNELFPDVHVIRNEENMGIAGGFNTGIRYAISTNIYKYLWLLDSDLQIDKKCLSALVRLMEENEDIAVSSPKILNSFDKNLIVTMGAIIELDKGQKYDLCSNIPDIPCTKTFSVDHVGAGNCLIRSGIINANLLFDERYFLQWEDADFGLMVKRTGHKIVTTTDAKVYHPPFTEKRTAALMAYYTYRNILLTVSKHSDKFDRITGIYNVLRRLFKECVFRATTNSNLSKLNLYAVMHFISNKWGQPKSIQRYFNSDAKFRQQFSFDKDINSIIIITSFSSYKDIEYLVGKLQQSSSNINITIITQLDRLEFYCRLNNINIITYNHISNFLLWEYLKTFLRLVLNKYDLAINAAPDCSSVFTYTATRVAEWDKKSNKLFTSAENIYSIWKIPFAFILGEMMAIIIFPIIYLTSFRYKIRNLTKSIQ